MMKYHKKYFFIKDKKDELLKEYNVKEYALFLEIDDSYLYQILNGNRHTTKTLAYSLSNYAGKDLNYYFKEDE